MKKGTPYCHFHVVPINDFKRVHGCSKKRFTLSRNLQQAWQPQPQKIHGKCCKNFLRSNCVTSPERIGFQRIHRLVKKKERYGDRERIIREALKIPSTKSMKTSLKNFWMRGKSCSRAKKRRENAPILVRLSPTNSLLTDKFIHHKQFIYLA